MKQVSFKGTHAVGLYLGKVSGVAKFMEEQEKSSGSFHNLERMEIGK